MKHPIASTTLAATLAALAACTSTSSHASTDPARTVAAEGVEAPVEPPAAVAARPAASRRAGGLGDGLSDVELRMFGDPAFRQRFAESYLAETDVEPRVTLEERDTMIEVLQLISDDRTAEALELLAKRGGKQPNAVFDYTRGNIHFNQDELAAAVPFYREAIRKFPNFRRAYKNLGLIYGKLGDYAEASRMFSKVIELGGGDVDVYGFLGISYTQLENPIAAESAYRMAILMDPETVGWKLGLARSFFNQGRFAEAVALFDTLIAENPDEPEFWKLQGQAWLALQQPRRAAENLELVDGMGAADDALLVLLGDIYINEKLYSQALDTYLRAMEMETSELDTFVKRTEFLAQRGAMEETRVLAERIESDYGSLLSTQQVTTLLRQRARAALAREARAEEAAILERIVELDPADGQALIQLGQYYRHAEDFERAAFSFQRAEDIEDSAAIAYVRHGQLLVHQRRFAEALPLLRKAQEIEHRSEIESYIEQIEKIAKK